MSSETSRRQCCGWKDNGYKGFTLLVLLLSLSIASIIFEGLLSILTSAKQNYRYTTNLAAMQTNEQFAAYLLTREIQKSGFLGCQSKKLNKNINTLFVQKYSEKNISQNSVGLNIVKDADSLTINFAGGDSNFLVNAVNESNNLTISGENSFQNQQNIFLSDCLHSDNVQVVSSYQQNLTISRTVEDYPSGTLVAPWIEETFYIGDTKRKNEAEQAVRALYLHQESGQDEEVLQNIAQMHIYLGYKNTQQQITYARANKFNKNTPVNAIKFILLFNSEDPILTQKQHIKFDGKNFIAPDNRLYQTLEIVVPIPNY